MLSCLGVENIKVWIRDAKEGMSRSDTHKSDIVVLKDESRMNILHVVPHKVVELLHQHYAVGAPCHHFHHLCRILIFLRPLPLLLCAILDCVSKQNVEKEVNETESTTRNANHPIEYSAFLARVCWTINSHLCELSEMRWALSERKITECSLLLDSVTNWGLR